MSQHPYITAFVIILVNPVPLACTWDPDLLNLPMTARDIVNWRVIGRCCIISRSIAIAAVGIAVAIKRK